MNRREFLKGAAATALGLALASKARLPAPVEYSRGSVQFSDAEPADLRAIDAASGWDKKVECMLYGDQNAAPEPISVIDSGIHTHGYCIDNPRHTHKLFLPGSHDHTYLAWCVPLDEDGAGSWKRVSVSPSGETFYHDKELPA